MADYYKVLGVSAQASEKEIKSAYRKLAKKYHPDAAADHPGLAEQMYVIQEAYDTLGDTKKRREYDERIQKTKQAGRTKHKGSEETTPNPDMTEFERFFGFQAGKGMETYRDKKSTARKPDGPISSDELFARYFGKPKR